MNDRSIHHFLSFCVLYLEKKCKTLSADKANHKQKNGNIESYCKVYSIEGFSFLGRVMSDV